MPRSRSEEKPGGGSEARWGAEPERIDPDDYPPLHRFARALTWAACEACGIQVHALASQYFLAGIVCPECGARLAAPGVREDPEAAAARVRREEQELRGQILSP